MERSAPGHADDRGRLARVIGLVMALFFAFGFCTVLVDTIIPKLKATFALSYAEVMLTQFCFFGAYFLVSAPAAWLHSRIGYLQGVAVGLLLMALGCLLFTPAANAGVYAGFLLALFVLASGVTIVQVAANPLATGAGAPQSAASRLTLAQAFNSLATTVGPIFGASFILANGLDVPDAGTLSVEALAMERREQASVFQLPFLIIAAALIVMAIGCWSVRHWVREAAPSLASKRHAALLGNRRLMFGVVSIFLYVGAEVSIGSSMTNYLMLDSTLSAAAQTAGSLVSVYWGLAMVGRFVGAGVMRKANPSLVLALCACGAFVMTATSSLSMGMVAGVTILAVGLFNSIMFPSCACRRGNGRANAASIRHYLSRDRGRRGRTAHHRRGGRSGRVETRPARAGGVLHLDCVLWTLHGEEQGSAACGDSPACACSVRVSNRLAVARSG